LLLLGSLGVTPATALPPYLLKAHPREEGHLVELSPGSALCPGVIQLLHLGRWL